MASGSTPGCSQAGHAGGQRLIRILHIVKGVGVIWLELETVDAQRTVRRHDIGVVDDLAGASSLFVGHRQKMQNCGEPDV